MSATPRRLDDQRASSDARAAGSPAVAAPEAPSGAVPATLAEAAGGVYLLPNPIGSPIIRDWIGPRGIVAADLLRSIQFQRLL